MTLIVCLDDRDGMLFLKRRQSQDSALRDRLLQISAGHNLWMNAYSAGQFTQTALNIRVDEAPLERAENDDFCFAENVDISCATPERLIIYRWNRHYPSDVKFPLGQYLQKLQLRSRLDFDGSSHEQITEEVYTL